MLSNPIYKRAFLEVSGATETEEYFPTTFNTVYQKSANYIQKLNKSADEAEVEKIAAEIELNNCFSSLAQEFRKEASSRASFEEFESQVFAKHGSAAVTYLDLLHKTACPNEERGIHDDGYMMFDQSKQAMMFDELMNSASAFIASEKRASEIRENLNFESGYLRESLNTLGKTAVSKKEETLPESKEATEDKKQEQETEEDPVLEEIKKKASDENYKVAAEYTKDPVLAEAMEKDAFFGIGTAIGFGKMIPELVNEHVSEAFSAGFKPHKSAPKPNMTLDNMERKLLLQELMMTDPILSKVNPARVARAFEQLLRLSPEISKEKEVVRAELRAMVSSQALSKFDADLMAKTDVGMLKRRIATQHFNTGQMDTFRI